MRDRALAASLGAMLAASLPVGCASGDAGGDPGASDGAPWSSYDDGGAEAATDGGDGTSSPTGDASGPDGFGGCPSGAPCPPANACHGGTIDCSTGQPVCTDTGPSPDGTSCGNQSFCEQGVCTACVQGAPCTPSNRCHTGATDCSKGPPLCIDSGNVADGTACPSGVCESGTCAACGASGQYCCAGGTCSGSPLTCISADSSAFACRTDVTPQCTCGSLQQPMYLSSGQSLFSCDGRFQLTMQTDGNLVLYFGASSLWASNTAGSGGTTAVMQNDGNFVVYASGGTAVWSSGTTPGCGSYLAVQNDGNVVIYDSSGTAVWSTGTCCH